MPRTSASLVVVSLGKKVLMMRRPAGGSYSDVWVFPGGAQDNTDPSLAYCALRETFEETGLLINPKTQQSEFCDRSTRFSEAISQFQGCEPALHPVSEWTTPEIVNQKRFTTQFFLTEIADEPSTTGFQEDDEVKAVAWVTPSECLEQFSKGEIKLFPPQFYLLNYLSKHSVQDVIERLKNRTIKPKPIERIPGGVLMDWGEEGRAKLHMDGKNITAIEWKL